MVRDLPPASVAASPSPQHSGSTQLYSRSLPGFTPPDLPSRDALQRCIRCGLCLPTCPTYVETRREPSSPRGRIALIDAVAEGRLAVNDPSFIAQMYECLDCRACEAVCPSGVEYGGLIEAARTQIERSRRRPVAQRLGRLAVFEGVFGEMQRFQTLARLLRLYQRSGMRALVRKSRVLRAFRLAEVEALLPTLPPAFLPLRGQVYGATRQPARGRLALFAGCIMSTAFADTDRATIRLLTANGYDVVVYAGQQCCGALSLHAGGRDAARSLAIRNILAFEACEAEAIVVNAAGCGAALKDYGALLADEPAFAERAAAFSNTVRDATQVLAVLLQQGTLRTDFTALPLRVTYQEPCHLAHAQRISLEPRTLLRQIPGLELVEMEEASLCCGSAGIYNLTHPDLAAQLGTRKINSVLATKADAVVTANPGCALQLRAALRARDAEVPVFHILDLLDAAYRGALLPH